MSAARWRPERCPGCCPAVVRSPTPAARVDVQTAWATTAVPATPGRDTAGIVAAARRGRAGRPGRRRRRPGRPARPAGRAGRAGRRGVRGLAGDPQQRGHRAGRRGAAGRAGRGEGRHVPGLGGPRTDRSRPALRTNAISDYRVARPAGRARWTWPLGPARPGRDPRRARPPSGRGTARVATAPRRSPPGEPPQPKPNQAVLATWRLLLDNGRAAGRRAVPGGHRDPRRSPGSPPTTAAEIGVAEGGATWSVSTAAGRITLPAVVDDLPDRVVWLPTDAQSSTVAREPAGHAPGPWSPSPGSELTGRPDRATTGGAA